MVKNPAVMATVLHAHVSAIKEKMITMDNIIFIGMAGCGKTYLGMSVARGIKYDFVDTDKLIEAHCNSPLQAVLDNNGLNGFLKIEEELVSTIKYDNHVIATGGSVCYSEKAMLNLKSQGLVVYIYAPFDEIYKRLTNLSTRGVVVKPGFTLEDVYNEREPLYRKYADIILDSTGKNIPQLTEILIRKLNK